MNVRDIPDPAALGFTAPKWAAAHREHARLQRELTETLALQGALRRKIGEAQAADSTAYADAIRAGKGDPGTPQTDAAKAELESVRRKAEALQIAVEQALRELVAAVEQEKPALLAELDTAVAERRATLAAAVDAWYEARTEHAEAVALRWYLNGFPEQRFKVGGGYLRNTPRGGDGMPPMTAEHVLALLRQDATEPVAAEPPAYARPLLPAETAVGVSGNGLRD
jgi:hypothetical protein